MSHEMSQTVQGPDGRWINVSGHTGQPLEPGVSYSTVEQAVAAAKARSASFMPSPLEPITTSGLDPMMALQSTLAQMQQVQAQPPVGPGLGGLGAVLAGLGSGLQGRPNPVLAQGMQQQQMMMQGLAQQANVLGTMGSLAQNARRIDLESARLAEQKADREETRKHRIAEISLKVMDDSLKTGNATQFAFAYKGLSASYPQLYPDRPHDELVTIATDRIARDVFEKNRKGVVSAALTGQTTYLGQPIPPEIAQMAGGDTAQRSSLAVAAGFKSLQEAMGEPHKERAIALRKKRITHGLAPSEEAELLAFDMTEHRTETQEIAFGLMEKDRRAGLPVKPFVDYMAAANLVTRTPSDMELVRQALMDKDPKMSRGTATLIAKQQLAEAGVQTIGKMREALYELDGAMDIMDQIEKYSKNIKVAGTYGRVAGALGRTRDLILQTDPDIVGLNAQAAFMAKLIRSQGEKGNLAQGDVDRAMLSIPTIHDTDEIRAQKIAEWRRILQKAQRNAINRFGGLTTEPPRADDPLGIR